ncbi:MAG TPA: hypothetical protein DCF68_07215 [Cyanothece sp. UBA12306]|nr:hypothetical protein [Cyanothece sp. UBA12306]
MKSLIRSATTFGLVGSTLLASWLGSTLNVLALTQEQIINKLNGVPVYTIGNNKEILLQAGQNNQTIFVTYMSHQQAQQVVEGIKEADPSKDVEVITLPLGKVYELVKEKEKNQSQKPPDAFTFVPLEKEIPSALSLLKEDNPKAEVFPGIPLFYAMVTIDNKQSFLSIKDGEKSLTPFYFEKQSLQNLVENLKKQQPELASSVEIKVTPLGGIVETFENSQNKKEQEEFAESVVLIPSEESAAILRTLLQQKNQGQGTQSQ